MHAKKCLVKTTSEIMKLNEFYFLTEKCAVNSKKIKKTTYLPYLKYMQITGGQLAGVTCPEV